MKEWLAPYRLSLVMMTFLPLIFIVQSLVGVFMRVRTGHVPGMPVTSGHDDFLFRVVRARQNLIEVMGPFILVYLLALLQQASPTMVNVAVGLFLVARVGHMSFYYMNKNLPRVLCFVSGNVATVIAIIASMLTWF